MGRGKAEQPQRMAEKLKHIRTSLGMTQEEMTKALEKQGAKLHKAYVALYEIGERVPTILIILAYARVAGISMEVICDDKLELPEHLQN